MTSVPSADVLDNGEVHLSASTDVDQLVRGLSEHDQRREKPECGVAWFFQHEPGEDASALALGVRGEIGALMWFDATSALIPADGTNTEYVDYFTAGGHTMVMTPGAELPITRVLEALREFAHTRQRPTCIEWAPEPEIHGA
ncbi:Imm1 family immunity protein [Saccharopolyspora sp. 5N708]|uniref:Imm1 family immunity protein n=1 Tax=Saccharopolyspora sp. 5N708 TaxID=3457424 RepID=UPI003FD06F00